MSEYPLVSYRLIMLVALHYVKPPVLTSTGFVKTPGTFDTALFINDPTLFGLRREYSEA